MHQDGAKGRMWDRHLFPKRGEISGRSHQVFGLQHAKATGGRRFGGTIFRVYRAGCRCPRYPLPGPDAGSSPLFGRDKDPQFHFHVGHEVQCHCQHGHQGREPGGNSSRNGSRGRQGRNHRQGLPRVQCRKGLPGHRCRQAEKHGGTRIRPRNRWRRRGGKEVLRQGRVQRLGERRVIDRVSTAWLETMTDACIYTHLSRHSYR
mmetsp:Transcript_20602/g.48415  ORF Transcript_20602/g.48415 Transcript_20602/m.48415 type:complete len:204 (+) Transcript_20602:1063-1674(+)